MREVITSDAIEWLKNFEPQEGTSLLASLPDISEFPGYSLDEWKAWFLETSTLVLSKTPSQGVCIFFQSDIRVEGEWIDKGYICQKAADSLGMKTLWHKVVCRAPVGQATFGRPGYSHVLCFTHDLKIDLARSNGDVWPETGEKTWVRGMGIEVCLNIARFLKEQTPTHTLIHPFCGQGSMLAAANFFGLKAVGIERSAKRAEKARQMQLTKDGQGFREEV
ncbi:MAG: hypothetical protein K2P81_09715 [Bacteriovoracaceae bacterium]|nr:hypothetical protein [Bacteriovoracaceae bacterium]